MKFLRMFGWTIPVILLAAVVLAQDAPAPSEADARAIRLVQPWSLMTTLSEDQKKDIRAKHNETLDKIRVLREEEYTAIVGTLNDEQKGELKKIEDDIRARRVQNLQPGDADKADPSGSE